MRVADVIVNEIFVVVAVNKYVCVCNWSFVAAKAMNRDLNSTRSMFW
jgi:hypothetical protein